MAMKKSGMVYLLYETFQTGRSDVLTEVFENEVSVEKYLVDSYLDSRVLKDISGKGRSFVVEVNPSTTRYYIIVPKEVLKEIATRA